MASLRGTGPPHQVTLSLLRLVSEPCTELLPLFVQGIPVAKRKVEVVEVQLPSSNGCPSLWANLAAFSCLLQVHLAFVTSPAGFIVSLVPGLQAQRVFLRFLACCFASIESSLDAQLLHSDQDWSAEVLVAQAHLDSLGAQVYCRGCQIQSSAREGRGFARPLREGNSCSLYHILFYCYKRCDTIGFYETLVQIALGRCRSDPRTSRDSRFSGLSRVRSFSSSPLRV